MLMLVLIVLIGACSRSPVTLTAPVIPSSSATLPPLPTLTPPPTFTSTPTRVPLPTLTPTPTRGPKPSLTLALGPYLQSVTSTSVIVVWETSEAVIGEVAYGETEAYGLMQVDPQPSTRHVVTLAGLSPYTLYHYCVEVQGWPLTDDAAFHTAAGPSQPSFSFVAFGDTRSGHDIHQSVIDRAVALSPDFALHTGDLVDAGDSSQQWNRFFGIEEPLISRAPLFPSLGNHEGNSPLYFDRFVLPGNARWYSFDYGEARFICLEVDGYARFGASSEQYAWLQNTLASSRQRWLIVFFHIPPYSALAEDDSELAVRRTLTPLFERYGVDLVFNGHHHDYQRFLVNGITYVVTGGGGAPLYPVSGGEEGLQAFQNVNHLVYVQVSGDSLAASAMTPDGRVFDRFTLSPRPKGP
jgi:hypothetical protein